MTSSQHGLYAWGYTRATMAGTKGCKPARGSQSQKTGLSSDWGLQLDPMKAESLVIADQNAAVNTFPGLVHTALSHHESLLYLKSLRQPQGGRRPRYDR